MNRFRPTWIEVDLAAIRHNVAVLRPPNAALMAIVKANAYGHGDVAVARAALEGGADWLGVALLEEALRLREAGVEAPILVLSELAPGAEAIAIAHRVTPVLYSPEGLARLAAAARGSAIAVHVKIDTGMHRVGVWPPSDVVPFLDEVAAAGLTVEGLFTHLASSEDDAEVTARQLSSFDRALEDAAAAGHEPRLRHAANSGGILRHPEATYDLVRPGIAVYGIAPAPGVGADRGLRPALAWRSRVTFAKRLDAGERTSYNLRYELPTDAWVATVPVGYADGYPRPAWRDAEVLIGGRRCKVAGTVTMDQLLVDCGTQPVRTGDDVVLLGPQGDEVIDAWELAGWAGTIAYEIVARLSERVPREHVG